ncbi:MAG: lamin tail domain-containing protein, partial [Chloroflexi bacterium]|nr:lamin tail domain-containing protein [Chloroflexota bacterium]
MRYRYRDPRIFLLFAVLCGLAGGFSLPAIEGNEARAAPAPAPLFVCPTATITQWTFTGNVSTPSSGAGAFASGSGLSPATPPYTYFGGPADPAISFSSWSATFDANDYLEFGVDTTGRVDIGISLDYRSTGAGPSTLDLYFSTDGTNFSMFGMSMALIRDSNFHPLSFNLSSVTALNNNTNAKFRLYAYGASGGNLRVDNVTITETCQQSPMISEVAWFGTQAFPGDEWIEIFNPVSGVDINLTNWRVETADGDPSISLSGTLTAGSYLLLERGSQSVVSDVAGFVYTSGQMSDSGEVLYLLDNTSSIVDSANSNGAAWPAGIGAPNYFSMERVSINGNPAGDGDFGWISNIGAVRNGMDALSQPIKGTPGGANWAATVTPTFTPTVTSTPTMTSTSPPSLTRA